MAMRKLQPALQFSQGRSRPWSGSELVNAFSEMAEGDKADAFAVMATPGLVAFSPTISTQPVRGVHVMDGVLYTVIGATLYRINSAGGSTSLGVIPGASPVMMADNGDELAIQSVNQGYVLSGGVLYTSISNLPQVSNVVYIDGYFVWTVYESDQFIISALNDGLTYDPLDVATVEGDPDDIVGCINDHRELQFYGARTVELWYNSGAADFPFARQGNAFIERGCIDRDSIAKIDNSVHFVGNDRVVYRLNGYDPVRISTHAIEYRIAAASWFRAFVYTLLGHKFYVLNTDVGCFAYDMATGAWHERKSLGHENYRISCATEAYGRTIMGGAYTGKLFYPDMDVNTEDGESIITEIQLPSLQTNRMKSTLYAFEAQIQAGVGTVEDDDPQIILQYSKDGGNTYSPGLYRSMGAMGEYLTRCIWRLGVQFRQLQIKLTLPSRVQRFVIAYYADAR
jgi:hypothetical protein